MTIPGEEIALYQAFILEVAKELGAMQCPPDKMLWHYTNGAALISILNSNEIYSTQISCLNDSTELKYGSRLFHTALNDLRTETGNDELSKKLLDGATRHFEENLGYSPASFHFVSCFSEEKDDLSQWRAYGGGENGYAIGFLAADLCGIPNSMLVRVNYDSELHQALAKKAAMEMVRFFKEAVQKYRPTDLVQFGQDFLEAWEKQIVMIAPMVKDPGFFKEKEYRIAKGYTASDLESLQFKQRVTMMSRHLPLQPQGWVRSEPYRLPISEIMVGPCRHPEISRTSVGTLLQQKRYPPDRLSISKIPFQIT